MSSLSTSDAAPEPAAKRAKPAEPTLELRNATAALVSAQGVRQEADAIPALWCLNNPSVLRLGDLVPQLDKERANPVANRGQSLVWRAARDATIMTCCTPDNIRADPAAAMDVFALCNDRPLNIYVPWLDTRFVSALEHDRCREATMDRLYAMIVALLRSPVATDMVQTRFRADILQHLYPAADTSTDGLRVIMCASIATGKSVDVLLLRLATWGRRANYLLDSQDRLIRQCRTLKDHPLAKAPLLTPGTLAMLAEEDLLLLRPVDTRFNAARLLERVQWLTERTDDPLATKTLMAAKFEWLEPLWQDRLRSLMLVLHVAGIATGGDLLERYLMDYVSELWWRDLRQA